jgi:hypothetical protein
MKKLSLVQLICILSAILMIALRCASGQTNRLVQLAPEPTAKVDTDYYPCDSPCFIVEHGVGHRDKNGHEVLDGIPIAMHPIYEHSEIPDTIR